MNPLATLTLFTPSRTFRRAASRVLKDTVAPDRAPRILEKAGSHHAELRQTRPRHSPGLMLLVRYFEWDHALFLAATEEGLSAVDAGQIIEDIKWNIFQPAFELNFAASRLRSKHLRTRVQWIVDLLFKVIFTAPFRRDVVPDTRDVAFNVTTCPLADYFRDRGIPELTKHAACRLDYRMAELWGVRLERSQTIARGHALCDFRFRVLPPEPGKSI